MLTDIIKTVFMRLNNEQVPATPDMYRKFFCEEAKKLGLYSTECNSINTLQDSLSYSNRMKLKKLNINDMDTLLDYLTAKLDNNNDSETIESKKNIIGLINLVEIVKDALQPSIGNIYHNEIEEFNKKIMDNPKLIENKDVYQEFNYLIEERFKLDKNVIINKTSELASILANITKSLNQSINANKDGSFNISNIKKELDGLDVPESENDEYLKDLKRQFMSIATSIESEANNLSTILLKENSKVNSLEKKIQVLEKQLKDAKKQSNTDFLTGAMTRKAFDERLKFLEKGYLDKNEDYSVMFFDLDHFKSINDTYGHDAGDKVLSTFSKLLLKEFKGIGDVARYGGEEFVVLLPKKDVEESLIYANKIQDILRKSQFIYEEHKLSVTFSGGICQRNQKASSEILIKDADELLYKAKQNGRDRIEIIV